KGTCGFLGFARLERVAHAAESLLAGLRDGSRSMTPEVAETLLRTGDAIRAMLDRIGATGAEGEDGNDDLVSELARLRDATRDRRPRAPRGSAVATVRVPEPRSGGGGPTVRIDVAVLDPLRALGGELVLARNHVVQLAAHQGGPALASPPPGVG